jgi:hypothetical protein
MAKSIGFSLLCLLLMACSGAPVIARPIVDVPPFPNLPACQEAHVTGKVTGLDVVFSLDALDAYRAALAEERECKAAREAMVEAWGRKVENRLKAVIAP